MGEGRAAARRVGRFGVWTHVFNVVEPAGWSEVVAALEEFGYDAVWFGEASGSRESLTTAALLLARSRSITVATGITNIYGRDPMAANAAARALDAASDGRFLLGLGVSHRPLVERDRKHSYQPPIEAMREYLDGLDSAPYWAAGPQRRPPRVLAALGPRMLELARERADGAHPYLVTPATTARAREALGSEPLVAVEQAVVLVDDRDEALRRAHQHLEIYTGLPNYRNNWRREGFGDDDFIRGGSERLAEALVVWGEDAIRRRVAEHLSAGADHVCFQVLAADMRQVPTEDWRRLAELVADVSG